MDEDVRQSPAKRPCLESLQAESPPLGLTPWKPKLVDWFGKTRHSLTKLVRSASPSRLYRSMFGRRNQTNIGNNRPNPNISSNASTPGCNEPQFVPYNMNDPSHHHNPMSVSVHSTPKRGNSPPSPAYDMSELQQHIHQRPPNVTVGGDGQFKIPAPRPYPPPSMAVPQQQMPTGRPPIRPTYNIPPRFNGTPGAQFNHSRNQYTPVYDKMYSANSSRTSEASQGKNNMAAKQSVKLEEKRRYAELLQQFTGVDVASVFKPSRAKKVETKSTRQRWEKLFKGSRRSDESLLGTPLEKLKLDESQGKVFMPQTLDVGKSQHKELKPGQSQSSYLAQSAKKADHKILKGKYGHQHQGARPKVKVDDVITLDDDDDDVSILDKEPVMSAAKPSNQDVSVIITGIEGTLSPSSPSSDLFEKAFKDSRFVSEDWISNLQEKYSSETRERQHRIKAEEDRVKFCEEKREEVDNYLLKLNRKQLALSAKELPVLEEIFDEEEDEPDEFPELTPEMESRISDALRPYPANQVLVDAFRLQISRKDFATLDRLNWLNDEVINFYMELIRERSLQGDNARVHAFNTFFYPKLMKSGHSSVRRWSRQFDIFAKDFVLVPVHLGMHWCLSVIDFRKKEIRYYDSMGGSNNDCLNGLRVYLEDESLDKKKQQYDTSDWKLINVKDIPHQMNGSDCGVFTCKFADYITRGWNITFSQEHMPYFRRRMVHEILTKQLL